MAKGTVSSPSQATISSFFSQKPSPVKGRSPGKRETSPVDLTVDDEARPPSKKARISGGVSTGRNANAGPSRTPERATGAAEQWRFSPEKPSQSNDLNEPPTQAAQAASKKRREAFKKRLLQENSLFVGRRSAAASDGEAMDVDDGGERNESVDASEDDSDEKWKELQETFSNKTKGKGKKIAVAKSKVATSTAAKGKQKTEEVGPSGEAYTPLEQQVSRCLPYMSHFS
jgi:DNA mismatch repair protein MSH3